MEAGGSDVGGAVNPLQVPVRTLKELYRLLCTSDSNFRVLSDIRASIGGISQKEQKCVSMLVLVS